MRYFTVNINNSNGNIQSCVEISETQYQTNDKQPTIVFSTVVIPIEATNPKEAQRRASQTFTSMRDAVPSQPY